MSEGKRKAAERAIQIFVTELTGMPSDQVADFLDAMACVGISLMRGGAGDEYVRGFLTGALNDLDKPSERYMMPGMH